MRAFQGARQELGYYKHCKARPGGARFRMGRSFRAGMSGGGRGNGQGQAPWNRLGHSRAAPVSRRRGGGPRSASPDRPRRHAAVYVCPGR